MELRGIHDLHSTRDSGRNTLLLVVVAVALVPVLAAPVALAGRSTPSKATVVNVKARDTGFLVSAKSAPVGPVTFVVSNLGKLNHDFKIAGKKTPVVKPGKTARLVVTFKKAGPYAYVSTVAGDLKRGLKGTLKLIAPKPATPGDPVAGKALFVANCGTCHTLTAAKTTGTIGPNLDPTKLAFATITSTVTKGKNGAQGAMPPFSATLTTEQIQDVAAFVYASTH